MKLSIYIILGLFIALFYTDASGQSNKNTTATITVAGTCGQCKSRIEKAAKVIGVKSAKWDISSHLLTVEYNESQTSLDAIANNILAAGHDVGDKKATTSNYDKLPDCCKYREELSDSSNANHEDSLATSTGNIVKGIVLQSDKKGNLLPLTGASIVWLSNGKGVTTDSFGGFQIPKSDTDNRLVISYTGYRADTITVTGHDELKIVMASDKTLKEVIVTSRQRSTYLSMLSPIRTEVITGKELLKAACCNLSESFETNPSVDVSYNDAVTGSKQIQLLGLSGNYTQLTVENLPGPRGIATPLGLNSIAGPWVESIQLTKGIGSVANGYESIAGQINVELKKPESEHLYANVYVNDFGKTDLNLNLSQRINKKWGTALLLHDDFLANKNLDQNKDGFRDLPTGNQFSLVNRWAYNDEKGLSSQFGVKVLTDNRTGGQTDFNASEDKYTTNSYGLGIKTNRYEFFAKTGYIFPEKQYKSIGLQLSGISHQQDSYFGLTDYNAKQQNVYANLIYQSIIHSTTHKFRTGISFLYDNYDEVFKKTDYQRREVVPGAFFEYTYTPVEKLNVVAGLRADHNNLFGFFATPRIHVRYEPIKGTTIRVSAGKGQRTANIFAENMSVFVSSRTVNIINAEAGKAYGLNPEVAWNKGISVDQKFKLFHNDALLSLDYFRNDFTNQVVVDLENTRTVNFYNLQGKSFSNSFQAQMNFEPVKKLEVRLAYRYYDVRTDYNGKLLERPLMAKNRAFANIAYAISGWKFDYTINYVGKKRIPSTDGNPAPYQLSTSSPDYVLMNAQISKTVGKKQKMDFYVGSENISNYKQPNAIVAADQPFSPYFDASMIWGPVSGRMLYAGWRMKID
ncbi:TonB-dependent receptor domain-containing protein [Pinibacter soli]|uniref:TonB-dependent receptor n=1 Tax=Pinibacter soli TaxID=3044211 RepID=A0ABT6RBW4_9BACT|nr:TonB-dependent receptor [Pinibacter soli]MDI3320020.1 TonB-dependent receptor [Pinibacter soli]